MADGSSGFGSAAVVVTTVIHNSLNGYHYSFKDQYCCLLHLRMGGEIGDMGF
jgi:hypothetical protein